MANERDKIKEKLRREFDRSGAGMGGLMRSMGLGPKDSDFDRMAEKLLQSSQPTPRALAFTPKLSTGLSGTQQQQLVTRFKRVSMTFPTPRGEDVQSQEMYLKTLSELIAELTPHYEAVHRFLKDGQFKNAEKWVKEAIKRIWKDRSQKEYIENTRVDKLSKFSAYLCVWASLTKELGDLYLAMGETGKAKKEYERVLDAFAKTYKGLGEWIYSQTWGAAWDWEAKWDNIAWLFMSVGDYKQTANMIKNAIKKDYKQNIHIEIIRWARFGAATLALGKTKDAAKAFERAEVLGASDTTLAKQVTEIIKAAKTEYGVTPDQAQLLKKAQPILEEMRQHVTTINEIITKLRELGLSDDEIIKRTGYSQLIL